MQCGLVAPLAYQEEEEERAFLAVAEIQEILLVSVMPVAAIAQVVAEQRVLMQRALRAAPARLASW